MALGSVVGSLLVLFGWILQAIFFDQWQAAKPFSPEEYLTAAVSIYAIPSIVGLAWGLTAIRHLGHFRAGEVPGFFKTAILLLREKRGFVSLDILLLIIPFLVTYLQFRQDGNGLLAIINGYIDYRQWPLVGAGVITTILLLSFRQNPFVSSFSEESLKGWLRPFLLPADALVKDFTLRQEQANYERAGMIPPDPATAPSFYFHFSLAASLPRGLQKIGIQLEPGLHEHLQDIGDRHKGQGYAQSGFDAVAAYVAQGPASPLNHHISAHWDRLIAQIRSRAKYANWQQGALASVVLNFVQTRIRFADDEPSTGYPDYGRLPMQTLNDGCGDAECKAILCCSLLVSLGFRCAFVAFKTRSGIHAVPVIHMDALGDAGNPAVAGVEVGPERIDFLNEHWLPGETVHPGAGSWGNTAHIDPERIVAFIPFTPS